MLPSSTEFTLWKPFDTPSEPPRRLRELFITLSRKLASPTAATSSALIFSETAQTFVDTYGPVKRGDFAEPWMKAELMAIYSEAISSAGAPRTESRFFSVNTSCVHSDTCLCHLSVSPSGGIPLFPESLTHKGQVRKENVKRMHLLLVQFLILLAGAGKDHLTANEAIRVRQLIAFMDPREKLFLETKTAFLDVDDDRRSRYISYDTALQYVQAGMYGPEGDSYISSAKPVAAICAVLGRRILVLSVVFRGLGYLFAQRAAVQYWDLQSLVSDVCPDSPLSLADSSDYLLTDARASKDQKKYPLRVINTHTLELETDSSVFHDCYAILSHTWTQNGVEVLYKDVRDLLSRARHDYDDEEEYTHAERKLIKVIDHCRYLGYHYVWVDNCLIDKENIPELNESLPSMGDWYANSAICIIYLEDYEGTALDEDRALKTRWATRGWTLQEAVMSPRAKFFNKDWEEIGDTNDLESKNLLAQISHVPEDMLCCGGPPDSAASLILRLAATRKTFKPEDRAYSLLGMLRVRINVDYGEGSASAMSRLFLAILRTTGDVTIFNWCGKLLQSPALGRSLYPVDYTAFLPLQAGQKPAYAMSPIRVDYVGVHARFDVLEFDNLVIGNDNGETLAMVRRLEAALKATRKPGVENTDVAVNVFCSLGPRQKFTLDVLCPLKEVKAVLEERREWVLARFAGLKQADWWLCGTEAVIGGVETKARRIATDSWDQNIVPLDKRLYRQRDMWIG